MFQKISIASAAAILAAVPLAAPASAADAPRRTAETKYCIEYEAIVGTLINRVDCMTKAQWALEGVDVEKLLRD